MIPYDSLYFFTILLIPILPAAMMGLLGISQRIRFFWLLISTLVMLWSIYQPTMALIQAALFFLWTFLIIRIFLFYRLKESGKITDKMKKIYYTALFLVLLPLILVKLSPYAGNLGVWNSPLGFLGISYLTFRAAGTVIEIRDGLIKEVCFLDFLQFVLFFPTLASGPIDRYRRFTADIHRSLTRNEQISLLVSGIDHIFRGLLYKFILAYFINIRFLSYLNTINTPIMTVQYMYVYSLYLFFDFAGYSAFAVGTSHLLGIYTPENFNQPFRAKNIKDFWNRWHMSLSFWFRDYIYMRFVLDSAKKRRFKNKYTSAYLGYLLLFGIMGIWHGTQLRYIVYGLYHAVLMIGYDWLERRNKKLHFWKEGILWQGLGILVTAHFVFFGFLIFSGRLF